MHELIAVGGQRAVQYLRMSTENQRYSLENQRRRIADYAAKHGYEIIDTYADVGQSGLTLKERRQLNRLLCDVTNPERQFSTILVLDVSRWGRFQDPDQHAAYEFLCRDLGAQVEYVCEVFENDGSVASSLLKHMKRVMAAEFSRDLSAKVTYAHLRGAARGELQGGPVGLGLRRLLVDANGRPKQELAEGERKALADDRVVVVRGPIKEQRIIQHIFKLFLKGTSQCAIARHLNHIGAPSTRGSPWSPAKVKSVLTCELYTGTYVFNRGSSRLKTPRVENPPSLWVRVPMLEGIVTRDTFEEAQRRLAAPRGAGNSYSTERMIAGARRLLKQRGRLSANIINACPSVPNASTYAAKFGSLEKLYAVVGYKPPPRRRFYHCYQRKTPYTRDELIAQLRRALDEYKYLSKRVIEECAYTASIPVFKSHFGSMAEAYRIAGYNPPSSQRVGAGAHDETDALHKLRQLADRSGPITAIMVRKDQSTPSDVWYRHRFGSLTEACVRAGIDDDKLPWTGTRCVQRECLDRPIGGQTPIKNRDRTIAYEKVLGIVRRIYAENGYINGALVFAHPELPNEYRLRKRFATLGHLYAAAGLPEEVSLYAKNRRSTSH